jgi:F-type H+-transporting ATPase subunit gamma
MNTTASLRLQLDSTRELQSLVRSMKFLAASSIGQYQASVVALGTYYHNLELGLGACLRQREFLGGASEPGKDASRGDVGSVVFGSDQGLVGQFNDIVAAHAAKAIGPAQANVRVWAVGERVHDRLAERGLMPSKVYDVPSSVEGITPLVEQILLETETRRGGAQVTELHVFYNRSSAGASFAPVGERLLPLDQAWRKREVAKKWPERALPQILGGGTETLSALLRGYLFVSLFRASAESLTSENASRLAAMERAERNIKDSLESLEADLHRERQSSIDEELFDVVAGFLALETPRRGPGSPNEIDPQWKDASRAGASPEAR